jgi:acetyltransferase-like isoleucine patch superfamily enzyme
MAVPLATVVRDWLREVMLAVRRQYLMRIWKMEIGQGTAISMSAKLDLTNPQGIHIGTYSVITFGTAILTHDYVNDLNRDVWIGDNCFIGAHSIVLPGVTIGNGCIVAAGSVVARDVPAGSLVAGNPARIVEHNVQTTHYGVRVPRAVYRAS